MLYVTMIHDYEHDYIKTFGAYRDLINAKEVANKWFGDDYYCEEDLWDGNEMRIYFYKKINHGLAGCSIIFKVDEII